MEKEFAIKVILAINKFIKNSMHTKYIKSIMLIIFQLLFMINIAHASPSVDSISGTFEDGQNVVIVGIDFGSISSYPEFLKDNIEAGTPEADFARTNWAQVYPNKATYSTADKHSGNKSILFDFVKAL